MMRLLVVALALGLRCYTHAPHGVLRTRAKNLRLEGHRLGLQQSEVDLDTDRIHWKTSSARHPATGQRSDMQGWPSTNLNDYGHYEWWPFIHVARKMNPYGSFFFVGQSEQQQDAKSDGASPFPRKSALQDTTSESGESVLVSEEENQGKTSDDSSVAMELMACELARAPTRRRGKQEHHCRREIAIFDPSVAPPTIESGDPRWRPGQTWAWTVQRAL